jgi:hypothetical protein
MDIDAVIIEAEFQLESVYNDFGHFINLKFIDTIPNKPKLLKTIHDIRKNEDVSLIDYTYIETPITEKTNLKFLEIIRH